MRIRIVILRFDLSLSEYLWCVFDIITVGPNANILHVKSIGPRPYNYRPIYKFRKVT